MKKIIALFTFFVSIEVNALVAPEIFAYDESCPMDSPFIQVITYRGTECQSCDSLRGFMMDNPEDCQKCPNREITNHNECRLKQCPENAPFYQSKWNWSGCKSCADEPTNITKEECDTCSNMRWVKGLNLCASNRENVIYYNGESLKFGHLIGGMMPYFISCEGRGENTIIRAEKAECERCPNAKFKDDWCYLNGDEANGK